MNRQQKENKIAEDSAFFRGRDTSEIVNRITEKVFKKFTEMSYDPVYIDRILGNRATITTILQDMDYILKNIKPLVPKIQAMNDKDLNIKMGEVMAFNELTEVVEKLEKKVEKLSKINDDPDKLLDQIIGNFKLDKENDDEREH